MSLLLGISGSQDLILVAIGSGMIAEAGTATVKIGDLVTESPYEYGKRNKLKWTYNQKIMAEGAVANIQAGTPKATVSDEHYEKFYIFPIKSDPLYPKSDRIIAKSIPVIASAGVATIKCDSILDAVGSSCIACAGRPRLKKVDNPTDHEFDLVLRMMGWK